MGKLTTNFVKRAIEGRVDPGRYRDEHGLILNVSQGGASWLLRYHANGARRDMGLGPVKLIGLGKARELTLSHLRDLKAAKIDPLQARQSVKAERAAGMTFADAAEAFISGQEAGWKNDKHRAQWRSTIRQHVNPTIGTLRVGDIDTPHVVKLLQPMWPAMTETASRVRGRIERILDWAKVRGLRHGENPARWRGHLDMVFPRKSKVQRVKHHAAVPIDDLPRIFKKLGKSDGTAAAATQFAILCASRPGEVARATWPEIDRKAALWIIPPGRMKADREHRVPLSPAAMAIIERQWKQRRSAFVFPGGWKETALSLASLSKALRVAGGGDATVHGTARSTFRDWASERTSHPSDVVEMALAHTIRSKAEAAYRRGDLLDKRKALMADWAAFVSGR
jgi:integrase